MNFRGKNIDLVGKQNLWFGISLAVILVGMVSWVAFGLNLGIDFKGGGQLQYRIPYDRRPGPGQDAQFLAQVTTALEAKGLRRVKLQIAGGNTLLVATDARGSDELRSQDRTIREALKDQMSGHDAQGTVQKISDSDALLRSELVGPVIGEELRRNAINGVIIGVGLIALWIYVRYNFAGDGLRYAVAGILALVHDVLVLVGLFALIGRIDPRIEVDGSFIAALLTVVGYSINDSVVIFDRIRENLRLRRREPFNKVVNDSLLETMSRSINTGLTVLIMLFALLLFGGESIYSFVLAMLVGITSGLYSSIFNASMVLTAWHSFDEKKAEAARVQRAGARAPGRTVTVRDTTSRASQPLLAGGTQARLPGSTTIAPVAATASSPTANGSNAAPRESGPTPETAPADGGAAAEEAAAGPRAAAGPGSAANRAARRTKSKRRF